MLSLELKRYVLALALVSLSGFSIQTFADESKCVDIIVEKVSPLLEGVLSSPNNIGYRGMKGTLPATTTANKNAALMKGAFGWGQRLFVMPSLEAAQAHSDLEGALLLKSVYIILKNSNLNDVLSGKSFDLPNDQIVAIYKKILADSNFEVYESDPNIDFANYSDGDRLSSKSPEEYDADFKQAIANLKINPSRESPLGPQEQLLVKQELYKIKNARRDPKQLLTMPAQVKLVRVDAISLPLMINPLKVVPMRETERNVLYPDGRVTNTPEVFLSVKGWFNPVIRGVIMVDETESSKTFKELRKTMKKNVASGFLYAYNHNFEEAIDALPKQDRAGKHLVTGQKVEMDPSSNRYSPEQFPELRQEYMDNYNTGNMSTVEKWSPVDPATGKRKFLGASFVELAGNAPTPDTVAYETIGDAKETVVMLVDLAKKHGIKVLDAMMVTPFTASMKGRYILGSEANDLLIPLRAQAPTFLRGSGIWEPPR